MANDQTANNTIPLERVPYNLAIATTDQGSTVAYAQLNARSRSNSEEFHVQFDTTQRESVISLNFLQTHFPSALHTSHIPPPADDEDPDINLITIVGSTEISIYIRGTLEVPLGLRFMSNVTFRYEDRVFRFDLRARVSSDGSGPGSLTVGSADMNCFTLAMCSVERALILRPNDDLATRGIMPFAESEEPLVNGVHVAEEVQHTIQ